VNVVDDTGIETDVRVDDERGGEDGVDDGLNRTEAKREVSAQCSDSRDFCGKMFVGVRLRTVIKGSWQCL
jgi:hypothetical protein